MLLVACTEQVEVAAIRPSKDISGLSTEERKQHDWAAFEVIVPASIARTIRRWELSNITLRIFRCDYREDAYPAEGHLDGKLFSYRDLREPLSPLTRLTFYFPQDSMRQQADVCAALDARGYSPIFLRSQTVRLPPLRTTFPHYDQNTGRMTLR